MNPLNLLFSFSFIFYFSSSLLSLKHPESFQCYHGSSRALFISILNVWTSTRFRRKSQTFWAFLSQFPRFHHIWTETHVEVVLLSTWAGGPMSNPAHGPQQPPFRSWTSNDRKWCVQRSEEPRRQKRRTESWGGSSTSSALILKHISGGGRGEQIIMGCN